MSIQAADFRLSIIPREDNMEYIKRCPSCGTKNNCSGSFCACGADLTNVRIEALAVEGEKPSAAFPGERPGCLTAYALLLYGWGVVGGILFAAAGIATFIVEWAKDSYSHMGTVVFMIGAGAAIAFVCYFFTRAFLEMRTWARYWALIQHGMNVPGSLSFLCYSIIPIMAAVQKGDAGIIALSILLAAFGVSLVALNGYALYWFAANGKYFS
jgi:hypothetical protein